MQKLILNLSAIFAFLGVVACSRGITEEGNSIAEFDLWDGSNGDLQVNMGNGVSGHWFSVNDGSGNGSSLIKFPTIEKENLNSHLVFIIGIMRFFFYVADQLFGLQHRGRAGDSLLDFKGFITTYCLIFQLYIKFGIIIPLGQRFLFLLFMKTT